MATITKKGISTIVNLTFNGYYQEKHLDGIEEVDGIYVAFACTLSKDQCGNEYCTPLRCIYIGKGSNTDNIHVRVGKHKSDDHPTWKRHLNEGEHILYSYADCPVELLNDVEAALIYKNQPEENNISKDRYTGATHFLTVNSLGRFGVLQRSITIW